ncbi:GldG family protein [Defluviitalea phaphyphila]|uniref:GldG family protein n=1 Tax=Defluviitalea phaphyphila TaxID=1473580 RepID=UPI0007303298|nr:GldG family protein [Defluviitalea phaphyphila]
MNKKFKFGGYMTAMTGIVLAVLIVINLLAGKLNLKLDLTENKLYSLSEQTINILDNLDKDVTIYALYETGKEAPTFDEILKKYSSYSKKIHIEYKDPILYPQFASQYDKDGEGIETGSLIVVGSNNKFKVISPYELVNYSFNQYTFQSTAESLAVEQKVTSAIQYVISDKNTVLYTLKGHDETELPYYITKQLENENYEVKDLNLITENKIPEDANVLLISSPYRDISEEEANIIKDYLENEGRAIFLMQIRDIELPNLYKIFNSYGIDIQKNIIVEGSSTHQFRNPIYIIPEQQDHDIIDPIKSKKLPILFPVARSIEILNAKKDSITIEPLLITSDSSYAKVNLQSETLEKEAEDIEGPFNTAVAITDKWTEDNNEFQTKLVVIGNSEFLDSQINSISAGGNMDFFLNSINWLVDKEENISIRPKSLMSEYLSINMAQIMIFSGITVIVIPLIIMIIGIIVWLRRKNK